jgi:DNA-binding IclR family transcriptional regulator
MKRNKQGSATVSPPHRTRAGTDVEQRRCVIVALLHQHPDGLTAREIREATGLSTNLTASALSGLFTRGVLQKRGHRYVLAAQEDALARARRS